MEDFIQIRTSNNKEKIEIKVKATVPKNTINTKVSIWRQFTSFCRERNYKLHHAISIERLAEILCDWAFNMKNQRK